MKAFKITLKVDDNVMLEDVKSAMKKMCESELKTTESAYSVEESKPRANVFYRDGDNFKTYLFNGTYEECEKYCKDNDFEWELNDGDFEIDFEPTNDY